MSKSYGNTIGIAEPPAVVATKIHGMSTNGQRISQSDPGNPDLCPVGDLHKIFSSAETIAETQAGCRSAGIRCEICKAKAANAVCDFIGPIHEKRQELESKIDDVWEMLRVQAQKAAARAEETMFHVRSVLNISRDLGAAKRNFFLTPEQRDTLYQLSKSVDWQKLPVEQLSKQLREYWKNNLLPYDIPLVQEANRSFASLERELQEPFLTARKKRVFLAGAYQDENGWQFSIPAKTYEIWSLLCWKKEDLRLYDFVIPQGVFAQYFSLAKKTLKKKDESIPLRVSHESGRWMLSFPRIDQAHEINRQAGEAVDITAFLHDYTILS